MTGVINADVGGYAVKDIQVAAAFDVHEDKVGQDVADAILRPPNNTLRFADVAKQGVVVQRGATLDGLGKHLRDKVRESELPPVDVAAVLRDSGANVVVSYLPVGSQHASEYYAEQAMAAGCAYVNCVPVFLASDAKWRRRFEERQLPIIGDDIKSQVGATIIHRMLANLFRERGARLDRTYQLNFGGNADFLNMLDRERLQSKKVSKTQSVNSQLEQPLSSENIHIGPSDFVPWLQDRKIAHIRLEGTGFGGSPFSVEVKLDVWDSPNSAGIVMEAVRCAKLALDRHIGGALVGPSSYYMKSPPEQFSDGDALNRTIQFMRG
jgi:myo-inositol-1-phosphate synthase